jgi:hypothetical protein
MVDCGVWFDEAKHENVKAMVDFAKQYGVYSPRESRSVGSVLLEEKTESEQ